MRQYELTYLISDDVSESELTKVTGKVGGLITELEGKIIKEESWGRRKLAYPINKANFATYVTVYFEIDPEKILPFGKDLRHIGNVIRQLIIVKDYAKEEITLTSEEIVENEDITEVIGNEKSAEAATEKDIDNRDLMVKRDKNLEAGKEGNKDEEITQTNTDLKPARSASSTTDAGGEVKSAIPKKSVAKKFKKKDQPLAEKTKKSKPTEAKKARLAGEVSLEEQKKDSDKNVEDGKEKKPAKRATKKTTAKKNQSKADESSTGEKTTLKRTAKDEADRLSKLDDELDELLKDEI